MFFESIRKIILTQAKRVGRLYIVIYQSMLSIINRRFGTLRVYVSTLISWPTKMSCISENALHNGNLKKTMIEI